jgi:heme-degrading monooxygenase HmoA
MHVELAFITAFEVPPSEDEAFLASHATTGTMHRALREDADFRFVDVASAGSPEIPDGSTGFAAHPGVYEVIRSDGRPDVAGGVLRIDVFEVPDAGERLVAAWERARDVLARQQGWIGRRLYRSVAPAEFAFVDVTRWSSPLMFARASERPEFRDATATPYRSHAALYTVVEDS